MANKPTLDEMRLALTKVMPHHQREANKAKFLEPSKVKDVLYRGQRRSPKADKFITTQDRATPSFTTDPEVANVYSRQLGWDIEHGPGSTSVPVHMQTEKPFDMRKHGEHASLDEFIDQMDHDLTVPTHHKKLGYEDLADILYTLDNSVFKGGAKHVINARDSKGYKIRGFDKLGDEVMSAGKKKDIDRILHELLPDASVDAYALADNPDFVKNLKKQGYDSIIHKDVFDAGMPYYQGDKDKIEEGYDANHVIDAYRPLHQNKIKSAIGNRGTYDTTNPDINKAKGGKVNEMMSQFMPPPDNEPFDPIETAKRNLQGAWDIVKQVPSNVANLASNPIEYTKNLPKPSIEQMAMMLQPSTLVGKIGMPKPKTTMLPKSEYDANLANYMAESKAPKLYHGTNKDITEFDKNKLKRIGWGEGFHMAEDPSMASQYAGTGSGANVMPVHASIKNPLVLNSPHDWWDIIPGETNQTKTAWAKSQGYDGIKYPHSQPNQNETGMAWVAFEPTQIKSAIGNRGTFDSNFADINKAKGGSIDYTERERKRLKLGEILPHKERQKNLRKMLESSQIKDRLYHATPSDIRDFKPGGLDPRVSGHAMWFSNDPTRTPAAHHIGSYDNPKTGVNVMPVHVQAKNPLVIDDEGMLGWARDVYGEGSAEFPYLMPKKWRDKVVEDYDSIILADPHKRGDSHEIIMFHPEKIKSAIGNRGTYDTNVADINKAKGGSVPSEPGSTPIKEGHVRLYHQTDGDNLREIEKHGLLLKHAKGIEGPRAIYAGETPFYGDATKKPTLEFQVPKEHWDAPFVLRDVHPQDFISAHYPWHRHARYLEDESGIKNVLSGKFDTLKGDEGKAVEYIKNKYSTKKAKGGNVMPKYPSIEEMLQKLQESGRTPIMPAPDRWFKKPEQHPFQQKAIEKLLAYTGHNREAFPHGAHINPLTGEPLDFEIMHDLGVAIDPTTGTPRMSGIKSGLTEIDPKLGSLTKSNLIRKGLFKHEGGDPLLDRIKFLATIEKSGKGHHYGLSTHYESPAELVQEMRGNPTLRPHSRGDIYGVGDEVGRISIKGMHHPVFEKLVVAPSGMNVQGKKLHKAKGGKVTHAHHLEIEERPL